MNTQLIPSYHLHHLNTGKPTKNRWLTPVQLPVDKFSFLFFSGVSCSMSWMYWKTGNSRKHHGDQWQSYNRLLFLYLLLQSPVKFNANRAMFECCLKGDGWKTIYSPTSGTSTRVIAEQSELEPMNNCDYCRVIWPGNDSQLHPFPLKIKTRC